MSSTLDPAVWLYDEPIPARLAAQYVYLIVNHEGRWHGMYTTGAPVDEERLRDELSFIDETRERVGSHRVEHGSFSKSERKV